MIFFFILIERSPCQTPALTNSYSRMMQVATYQRGEALHVKNRGYHATLLAGLLSFLWHIPDTYIKKVIFT